MKKSLSALLALLMALALIPAAMFTALAVEATKVTGVNVVDGTEGWGPFPIPLEAGQVLLANIQTDAGEIGSYPVNEDAVYKWFDFDNDDNIFGTQAKLTITSDIRNKRIAVKVSVNGLEGEATWVLPCCDGTCTACACEDCDKTAAGECCYVEPECCDGTCADCTCEDCDKTAEGECCYDAPTAPCEICGKDPCECDAIASAWTAAKAKYDALLKTIGGTNTSRWREGRVKDLAGLKAALEAEFAKLSPTQEGDAAKLLALSASYEAAYGKIIGSLKWLDKLPVWMGRGCIHGLPRFAHNILEIVLFAWIWG